MKRLVIIVVMLACTVAGVEASVEGGNMSRLTLPETMNMRVTDLIAAGYNDGVIQSVSSDCSVCAVRHAGSGNLLQNVTFSEQISDSQRTAGKRVKLGMFGSKVVVLQTLGEVPSQGTVFAPTDIVPTTPSNFAIVSHREGWYCTWDAVSGAAYYDIFSDNNADGTSPVERMSTDATHIIVPYSATTDTYFAVRAVSYAGYSGDLTAFLTDSTAPDTPSGFSTAPQVGGVLLKVAFGTDTAHTATDFKEFIAYRANDGIGTGSTEIGRFSDSTWLYEMEMGTEKYFAISAVDWAGNESSKCSWTLGQSLRENALQDDFSKYGGDEVAQDASAALYWLKLSSFNEGIDASNWTGGGTYEEETSDIIEGNTAIKVTETSSAAPLTLIERAWDISQEDRFGSSDKLCVVINIPTQDDMDQIDASGFQLRFVQFLDPTYKFATEQVLKASLSVGKNFLCIPRSSFAEDSGFDWSDVYGFRIGLFSSETVDLIYDDLRIVKADPDDSSTYNDTGGAWDFSGGEWHVYGPDEPETGVPYSLGQIKDAGGSIEYVAAYTLKEFNSAGDGFRYVGRVRAFKDDGKVGLAWAIQDLTEGSEDLYVAFIDTSGDKFYLQKAEAGSYSSLETAVDYTCAPDTWYWIGIEHKDNDIEVYISDTPAVFQGNNLKFSTTDSTYTQGQVGVWTEDSKARFTDLSSGSPDFAFTAYLSTVMKEGGGYGRQDYVMATDGEGRRVWVDASDPADSRSVKNGDIWFETDTNSIHVRESGSWVSYIPSGIVVMWDNSDDCPTGWTELAGAASRIPYFVAAGPGGTGGATTHYHDQLGGTSGTYGPNLTTRIMASARRGAYMWTQTTPSSGEALQSGTDAVSHLYSYYEFVI